MNKGQKTLTIAAGFVLVAWLAYGAGARRGELNRFIPRVHLGDWLEDEVRALVNELRADHATNKTTIDESRTAIVELIVDHATYKTVVDEHTTTLNELISDIPFQNQVLSSGSLDAGLGVGLAVDDGGAQAIETTYTCKLQVNGLTYRVGVDAQIDVSTTAINTDTIGTSNFGVGWVFFNTAGAADVESDATSVTHADAVTALAQYSVATNTLPPGTDDVCIGAVLVNEGGSGVFTWGPDSITAETETYYSFENLPGIESAMASFAAAGGTFSYGAATIRLGTGTRVALTGKTGVTIAGSNVADAATGAWLFYASADDTEVAVQLGAAYADLATAQAAVRDATPNPFMPLLGAIYVVNASGANFVPGTTSFAAAGITSTFTTYGPGANHAEQGRAAAGQPHQVIQNAAPAALTATNPTASAGALSAGAVTTLD